MAKKLSLSAILLESPQEEFQQLVAEIYRLYAISNSARGRREELLNNFLANPEADQAAYKAERDRIEEECHQAGLTAQKLEVKALKMAKRLGIDWKINHGEEV